MAHPSKRKGDRFERAVTDYLQQQGLAGAERALGAGRRADIGDILGIPGMTIQCKAQTKLALSGWLTGAAGQACNAGTDCYVVIHTKRGVNYAQVTDDFGDHYVTMPLAVFARWTQL